MKYGVQDCFHVSAAEAETWKRALAMPAETDMMAEAGRDDRQPNRPPLFGSLFRLPARWLK